MTETLAISGRGCKKRAVRVLFDSPAAWPVLCPGASGGIGGAELRAMTFARELAAQSEFDIHVLVHAQHPASSARGVPVTVHFEPPRSGRTEGGRSWWAEARRVSDRLTASLAQRCVGLPERNRFVEALDFDLLCCFGVTNRTASLVRSARHSKRRVCAFLTSDRTLLDIQRHGRRQRGAYGELGFMCRYALQRADVVVVQKQSQQSALIESLGIRSVLIRNPIDLHRAGTTYAEVALPVSPFVLWVGRADTFSKRADRCWELAKSCPEIPFVVVMNRHVEATYDLLESTRPANVTLIQQVPATKIESLFRNACLVANTSDAEGFPNSFLQAGKYGVPIVSLNVDPDGMLCRYGGGICCDGSMSTMQRRIRELVAQGADYQHMSGKILQYTQQFHGLPQRTHDLAEMIHHTLDRPAAA